MLQVVLFCWKSLSLKFSSLEKRCQEHFRAKKNTPSVSLPVRVKGFMGRACSVWGSYSHCTCAVLISCFWKSALGAFSQRPSPAPCPCLCVSVSYSQRTTGFSGFASCPLVALHSGNEIINHPISSLLVVRDHWLTSPNPGVLVLRPHS
jgi:hypothetical protein